MTAYVMRRVLLLIPTLLLVTILVFLSVRFIPGDVVDMMIAQMGASGSVSGINRQYLEHEMGLDVPMQDQYLKWMGVVPQDDGQYQGLLEGNLGKSLWKNEPVTQLLFERVPVSMELGIIALLTAVLTAIPIGVYSAIRQDTAADYLGRSISIIFISVPSFWIGTMVMVYPAIWWKWAPPLEYVPLTKSISGNLLQFLIPGFILGMVMGGGLMRMARTMMLEVLRQDYVRTAWAKGLRENTVIRRHAFKNAMIPLVTILGIMVPVVLGGTVVTEQIFALPGVGLLMFESLTNRDYPMIQGINLFMASFVIIINLLVDLAYGWLDPRVQYK